jgi:hypothetical protein
MEIALATRAIAKQKVVNVMSYGVSAGKDATAGFNAAIKAVYDAGGGTVEVPQGTYIIDMLQQIDMRDYVHLKMHPLAELIGKPNGEPRYGMINMRSVNDAIISGGRLVGDRDKHNYSVAGTHEWGHAIQFYGAERCSVYDTVMTGFTGDGISIGRDGTRRSNDIEIARILSTRNRRQGISIVTGDNVLIYQSECSWTGDDMDGEAAGTAPMCGIDIEPEKAAGSIKNIRVIDCKLLYNKRFGFLLERRSDANGGADVYDVEVAGTEIAFNFSNGFQNKGGTRMDFHDNHVHDNSASGTVWTGDKDSKVWNNRFGRNYTRNGIKEQNPAFVLTGTNSKTARDILKQSGTNVNVGVNNFY